MKRYENKPESGESRCLLFLEIELLCDCSKATWVLLLQIIQM